MKPREPTPNDGISERNLHGNVDGTGGVLGLLYDRDAIRRRVEEDVGSSEKIELPPPAPSPTLVPVHRRSKSDDHHRPTKSSRGRIILIDLPVQSNDDRGRRRKRRRRNSRHDDDDENEHEGPFAAEDDAELEEWKTSRLKNVASVNNGVRRRGDGVEKKKQKKGSVRRRISSALGVLKSKNGRSDRPLVSDEKGRDAHSFDAPGSFVPAPQKRIESIAHSDGRDRLVIANVTDVVSEAVASASASLAERLRNGVSAAASDSKTISRMASDRIADILRKIEVARRGLGPRTIEDASVAPKLIEGPNPSREDHIQEPTKEKEDRRDDVSPEEMFRAAREMILVGFSRGREIVVGSSEASAIPEVKRHICDERCTFDRTVHVIGMNGCDSVARRLEMAYGKVVTKTLSVSDLWTCRESGETHVCTYELCDAKHDRDDGRIECWKTGRIADSRGNTYGRVFLPAAESYSASGAHPSASVVRSADAACSMSQILSASVSADAPIGSREGDSWKIVHKSAATSRIKKKKKVQNKPGRKRQTRGRARDVVCGRSEDVARLVLERRCTDFGHSSEGGKKQRSDVFEGNNPPQHRRSVVLLDHALKDVSALSDEARIERARIAGALFSRWTPGPVSEPSDLSAGYVTAIEIAAVAIVSIPETIGESWRLSNELAASYIDKYATIVWNGWTLASWYASAVSPKPEAIVSSLFYLRGNSLPAIEAAPQVFMLENGGSASASASASSAEAVRHRMTETDGRRIFDVSTKLRQLAFGLLYQARYGFITKVDPRTVLGYEGNEEKIAEALASAMHVPRTDHTIDDFVSKTRMVFLKKDKYLEGRLVEEHKIGTRGTIVDGLRVDGTIVNEGVELVKMCFSGIASWSTTLFVSDIVSGMDPTKAFEEFEQRSSLASVG